MIKKMETLQTDTVERLRGGEGETKMTHVLTGEDEFVGMGRLFAKLTLAPGHGVGFHKHEGEQEAYYILEGKALYDDNGTKVEIGAGDVTLCPSGEGHSIQNIGDTDLTFMALVYHVK